MKWEKKNNQASAKDHGTSSDRSVSHGTRSLMHKSAAYEKLFHEGEASASGTEAGKNGESMPRGQRPVPAGKAGSRSRHGTRHKSGSGYRAQGFFRKRWVKTLAIILGIVIVLVIAGVIAFNAIFGFDQVKQVELDESDLGIVEEEIAEKVEKEKLENILNIALFGIDTTEGAATIGDQYRSDSIIVCSIDPLENKIRMVSILRDSKVPIEGHDPQKINAAYKYGGPQLAVKTLNQNFKTNIKDYVTVDFAHMAEIIDLVGGLTIEITDAEAQNMMLNNIIKPVQAGKQHLDGAQCVAYARVRKVDSDYYRAGRQQKVLSLLFDKIKSKKKSEYPKLIKSFLKCVETSLSYGEIMKIVRGLDLSTAELLKFTIPDPKYEPGLFGGTDSTGAWVWIYDLDKAADRLRKILYGGFKPDETAAYVPPIYSGGSGNSNSQGETTASQETTIWQEETTTMEEPTYVPSETTEDPTETTEEPTETSSEEPTEAPSEEPSENPTEAPSEGPSEEPSEDPTNAPDTDSGSVSVNEDTADHGRTD